MLQRKKNKRISYGWKRYFWWQIIGERQRCRVVYSVLLILGILFSPYLQVQNAQAAQNSNSECADVEFIFVRGSGEVLGEDREKGKSYIAWRNSIKAALGNLDITTKFYNLGTESHHGYQYPAAAVTGSLQGILNLTGAYFSAGEAYEFGRSVEQGRGELVYYLIEEMQQCPKMKFVLGGYSQGAMILTKTLNQLYAPRILYVSTFGDPKLYLPEGKGTFKTPDACKGVNLSPYREYVPDCHAYTGVLGSVRPYQPDAYEGKLGTWCNQFDIMCSSGMNIADHSAYVKAGLYKDAAQVIRQKVEAAFPDKVGARESNGLHDLALLFDITGSMKPYFRKYRLEALRLAEEVLEQGGKVELYTYGDVNHGTFPSAACKDCTLEELDSVLKGLTIENGWDLPESLLSAAMYVLDNFDWTFGATKTIVALTDATYHPIDEGFTASDVIKRSLEIDPVNIYVVSQEENIADYQTLVDGTGGAFYDIDGTNTMQIVRQQILSRPVAKLSALDYAGEIGEKLWFDASSSYSIDEEALEFDWDLDSDGDYEIINGSAKVSKTYSAEFSDYIQVRVSDSHGHSTMSAKVEVVEDSYWNMPTINDLTVNELENGEAKITFRTDADKVLLSINGAMLGLVELKNSKGEVVITDTFANLEVSLAPYRAERRGEVKEFVLFENAENDNEELPDLSEGKFGDDGDIEIPDSTDKDPGEAVQPSQPIETTRKPNSSVGAATVVIEGIKNDDRLLFLPPKAPNTGARSSRN